MIMDLTMTKAAPRVLPQSPRRLSWLASLLAAFALAITFIMAVPLRVGECGPPDPYLLRYLGAPFFHSTGYGASSSLEATIWAGPFLANIAVITALILSLNALNKRRPSRAGRVPRRGYLLGMIAMSSFLIVGSSWLIAAAHNVLWTLASLAVTAPACDIRFDPFTDTEARVTEPQG